MTHVCREWRSTFLENRQLLSHCVPLLLFRDERAYFNWKLFDFTSNGIYMPPYLLGCDSYILGCSGSWLLIITRYSWTFACDIWLLNPLTRTKIFLPPVTTLSNIEQVDEKYYIQKLVMSSNVNSSDCMVMAIHGGDAELGFCRIGEERWTKIETYKSIRDVTYHKGQFYAMTKKGAVMALYLGPNPKMTEYLQPPELHISHPRYLVDSCDELLMVCEYLIQLVDESFTTRLCIHRLDTTSRRWEKVTSLDDRMLFLENGCYISISAPNMDGFKQNFIYFKDRAYNLRENTWLSFYSPCQSPLSDAVWFTPAP